MKAFSLTEALRDHVKAQGLERGVQADVEPAPVLGDYDRLPEALGIFLKFFVESNDEEQTMVKVEWVEDRVHAFVGARPAVVSGPTLQTRMARPTALAPEDPDLPLARAIIEAHEGRVIVGERDGALGYECTLTAIDCRGFS